jgi:hypothetical protein
MQKFKRGDVVRIADDLGPSMDHFDGKGEAAVVMGSYADEYGGENTSSYTLMLEDGNEVSWYEEHQLTFIRRDKKEIQRRTKARDEREEQETSLAWIVANWAQIRNSVPGATMQHLATMAGLGDLWGARGEGMDYFANALAVFRLFDPALSNGDEAAVRELAANLARAA